MPPPYPSLSKESPGFALVITLALMAMLVLLVISLSTLVQLELSTNSQQKKQHLAQMNALLGMEIALGQLQQYAGSDQRITAPATTYYPNQDSDKPLLEVYREHAENRRGYFTLLTPDGRTAFNDAVAEWWAGDQPGKSRSPFWLGVWNSTLENGVPDRNQTPVWLVSQDGSYTPESLIDDPSPDNDILYLVDEGSAVDRGNAIDGYDGRVKAQKMAVTTDNTTTGHYAYWVGDESVKANLIVRDPFYEETNIQSREYRNRLQVPQRVGWENIEGFDIVGSPDGPTPNDTRLELLTSISQIDLLDDTLLEPVKENFHSLTSYSNSLLTDPARGGLKKDLTVYFEKGDSATNGDIQDGNPIPDPNGQDPLNYTGDVRFGNHNSGFPQSDTHVPTWGQLKHWYDNEASGTGGNGAVSVDEEFGPMVTYVRIFSGYSYENGQIYMHLLPTVVLWNPYDATLASTDYTLSIKFPYNLLVFQVASDASSVPYSELSYDDNSSSQNGYQYTNENPVYYDNSGAYFMEGKVYGQPNPVPPSPGTPVANLPRPQYYIHEMDGVNGINATRTAGDFEQSQYALKPWEDDAAITLTFTAQFAPGESLIFSVEDDVQVSRSLNAITIPVANTFVDDQPASARFPILSLQKNPITTDGMLLCVGARNIPNKFDISLTANGQSIFEAPRYGYALSREVQRNTMYGYDRDQYTPHPTRNQLNIQDKPDEYWRTLYTSSSDGGEFRDMSGSTTEDSGGAGSWTRDAALIALAEQYIAPFATLQNKSGNHDDARYVDFYYRSMATHNLNARILDTHPTIDQRLDVASQNTDKFGVFRIGKGRGYHTITGNPNTEFGLSWDNNLKDGSGDIARGSSLMTYYYPTPQDQLNAFSSFLPMRLVKRPESELVSLGQLQQVNLSYFFWQPAFPIGNAEASPYIDRELIAGIESRNVQTTANGAPQTVPNNTENESLDISYLLNDSLWDRYFLSTLPQTGSLDFSSPTWANSRLRPISDAIEPDQVRDYDKAAAYLYNVGALNVNSTSVEAWKSLLTAFRDLKLSAGADPVNHVSGTRNPDDTMPIARSLAPLADPIDFTFDPNSTEPADFGATSVLRNYYSMLAGFRYLTDDMIEALSERIVDEVRLRGPFMSVADFVNRRLVAPDRTSSAWLNSVTINSGLTYQIGHIDPSYDAMVGISGLNGTLQRALNLSGINGGMNYSNALKNSTDFDYTLDAAYGVWPYEPVTVADTEAHFNIAASLDYYLDMEHVAGVPAGEYGQIMSHLPGFVTQGDLLAMIGPVLTARGDTFMIRSYGDHVNPLTGEPDAKAWLEVIVQRTVEPLIDQDKNNEPDVGNGIPDIGRKFKIISMRWLSEEDV